MVALNGVSSVSPPLVTKNERRRFSPASNFPVSSTFSNAKSGPMLLRGASSQGSNSEFPVEDNRSHPASSAPLAQQLRSACSERVEGSPRLLKSYRKLNMVFPSKTVVAFLTSVMGSHDCANDRIWHVKESGLDQPCSSAMFTPISTSSRW